MTKKQLRILKEIDVDAAIKLVANKNGFMTDNKLQSEAGLHKARINCNHPEITKKMIKNSKVWLKANGFNIHLL